MFECLSACDGFYTVAASVRHVPNHSVTCPVLSVSLRIFLLNVRRRPLRVFVVCPLHVFVLSLLVPDCGDPKKKGEVED